MTEIAADLIACSMELSACGELNLCRVWISVRVGRIGVGRINTDVMATITFDQLALCCDRPLFDVRHQPVGIRENEICNIRSAEFLGPFRGANESSNHNSER